MKLTPNDVLGVTINRVVCTEPPAEYYPYKANLILDVADHQLLGIGMGTICYGKLDDGMPLFPAVAWQHTKFLNAPELQGLIAGCQIKRLIRTRANVYDQSMIVLSNDIVIGNCDTGGQRILFVRSRFDEKRELKTQYWDYFSSQPVDHVGNNAAGEPADPIRTGWI